VQITPQLLSRVTELLGRTPRGLEDVTIIGTDGEPVVIRVASLVDEKPFPTLFWLVDRDISYRIDQAEAAGVILELQALVDDDTALQASMRADHRAHIRLRAGFMREDLRLRIQALGFEQVFATRGIGGIADFQRIRCLHTWYAAHLVVPNTVGRLLDAHWRTTGAKASDAPA